MKETTGFCREAYVLPQIRCEEWLGWIYITLNRDQRSVRERLRPLEAMISQYEMQNYVECFRETHIWDTNWKVLAENFMESYHLPVCHAATVGPYSKLNEMVCPPGLAEFNYHWITKDASLAIGNAHPGNTRLEGHWRKTTGLLAIYPSHLITLTPGYFWYLSLHPHGIGRVHMSGISKSQVSRLCEEIDGKVKAFLERPIEGDWPYLWIDATYLKVDRKSVV